MSNTAVIKDLTFNWAHLSNTVNPFGMEQWDIQATTTDPDKAEELKALGLKVKENDGVYSVNVKRKAVNAKGDPNTAPEVVGADKQPMTPSEINKIGNGSKGHLKVFKYDYNFGGRSGTGVQLTAVMITELVEYDSGESDWD